MTEHEEVVTEGPLAVATTAGHGRTLLWAHATGFCKEMWRVVSRHLPNPSVAWDARSHGHSFKTGHPIDWWDCGRDALAVAAALGGPRPAAVGHSMGGASLILAELEAPGTFSGLVLVEPIVFPPPFGRWDGPLVASARRRRSRFESLAAARAYLQSKSVFAPWPSESLSAYLSGGFEELSDGSVRLRCEPDDEAEVFAASAGHGGWERLGELAVPTLILAGTETETYPVSVVEEMAGRIPGAVLELWEGADHFIPMTLPERLAERVGRFVADLG